MTKVINIYGGTTWLQHSGYFLRGATSGVVDNSATKTGGNDDAIVVSHHHTTSIPHTGGTGAALQATATSQFTINKDSANYDTTTVGSSGTNANIPNYKSVYIWERTA